MAVTDYLSDEIVAEPGTAPKPGRGISHHVVISLACLEEHDGVQHFLQRQSILAVVLQTLKHLVRQVVADNAARSK